MIGSDRNAVLKAIREARIRAGLTQEKAAALRGHATSTISRWETGGLPKTWDDLIDYAHALGQPIVLQFGPGTTESPPAWAEGLAETAVKKLIAALAPAESLQVASRIRERLEALPPQGGAVPLEEGASGGPATAAQPDTARESHRDQVAEE